MYIKTENCEIKTCNNKQLKSDIDRLAEKNFDLPTIKLKPGQSKDDFLPAIEELIESLKSSEEATEDEMFEVTVDDKTAGYIRLVEGELQVAFLPEYQGKGYAYETLSAFLNDYDFQALIWRANPNNKASIRLINKLGGTLDKKATESVGGIIETYTLKK